MGYVMIIGGLVLVAVISFMSYIRDHMRNIDLKNELLTLQVAAEKKATALEVIFEASGLALEAMLNRIADEAKGKAEKGAALTDEVNNAKTKAFFMRQKALDEAFRAYQAAQRAADDTCSAIISGLVSKEEEATDLKAQAGRIQAAVDILRES